MLKNPLCKITLLTALVTLALPALAAPVKLALVGHYPDGGGIDAEVANLAVENAANDPLKGIPGLQLAVFNDGATNTGAAEAARQVIADGAVRGVVIQGEASAAPEVLQQYHDAGLAVIAATSWFMPRGENPTRTTWLSPTQDELARVAANYARRARKLKQVAVLDNSSPTSNASADAFETRFKELGGKVVFRGEWQGSHWGMTRTVKALKANWPQAVFVPLEPEASGRLVKEMKRMGMAAAILIGEPRLFESDFFHEGRMATQGSVGILPWPDYRGRAKLRKHVGLSWSRNTAHWKAYMYSWQNPRRKTSMVFDAAMLMVRAMRNAAGDEDLEEEDPEGRAPEDVNPGDADTPEGPDDAGDDDIIRAAASGTSATASLQASPTPGKLRRWKAERQEVRAALNAIDHYRGIRGRVQFEENRRPKKVQGMVLQALPKVNSKWMKWWDYKFGPPW